MLLRSISFAFLALFVICSSAAAATCDSLASLTLKGGTVLSAHGEPAGRFEPPVAPGATAQPVGSIPAFCRVYASLEPTSDSDIRIEVWLPLANWNGKLQSVGNSAWGGVIPYGALGDALRANYVAAATDTGHVGNNGKFAQGHPEQLVDYGSRAVHEMTVAAKALIAAFYGKAPTFSYWNGCSTGGRQGMVEAQRYPADYDGIIAGAPVNFRTHQLTWELWIAQAVHKDEASFIPSEKYPAIHKAALNACDAKDGVADGVIDDPTRCRFDPRVLQCKGKDTPDCLTAAQVKAARTIYTPATNPRTKKEIFPALQPGGELAWGSLAGRQPIGEAVDFFQYVVYNDPSWDYRTLDFSVAADAADKAAARILNATDPDLSPFFARGGKLLIYHGWNDQFVAPLNSVNYYQRVLAGPAKSKARDSIRLFMMPGTNHCRGGDGPHTFDQMQTMERWVEQKQAPRQVIASHTTNGRIDRTRPVCAYPTVARYDGRGSTDEAQNFRCERP
jgi:feruloyl esterase